MEFGWTLLNVAEINMDPKRVNMSWPRLLKWQFLYSDSQTHGDLFSDTVDFTCFSNWIILIYEFEFQLIWLC